jgi:hypothetical protein
MLAAQVTPRCVLSGCTLTAGREDAGGFLVPLTACVVGDDLRIVQNKLCQLCTHVTAHEYKILTWRGKVSKSSAHALLSDPAPQSLYWREVRRLG